MFTNLLTSSSEDADLPLIMDGLRELYSAHDLATFPRVSLRLIRRLIPCLFASYNELNLRTGGVVIDYEPEEVRGHCNRYLPLITKYEAQHPLLRQYQTTGAGEAQMISDFVGFEELQQTDLYRECLAQIGVGESLSFSVHSSASTIIFFVLNRAEPDFTERDRALANLLRPHLIQAYDNARAFTETRVVAAIATEAVSLLPHGILIADHSGNLRHANEIALELLQRFLPAQQLPVQMLPAAIADWLAARQRTDLAVKPPFRLVTESSALVVRALDNASHVVLLLQEEGPEPKAAHLESLGLSNRETEVLFWLSRGKSNAEIGIILGISDRTVGKHLERIYPTLGVSNRAAAISAALRVELPQSAFSRHPVE